MRTVLLVAACLTGACAGPSRRDDYARPGTYVFVAHVEAERELGPIRVDDGAVERGTFDVHRQYPSEADAQAHTIHLGTRAGVVDVRPGQCGNSCGVMSATVREAQQLHCEAGFDHEEIVVSVGRKGGELGTRRCSGPAGTFELTPY